MYCSVSVRRRDMSFALEAMPRQFFRRLFHYSSRRARCSREVFHAREAARSCRRYVDMFSDDCAAVEAFGMPPTAATSPFFTHRAPSKLDNRSRCGAHTVARAPHQIAPPRLSARCTPDPAAIIRRRYTPLVEQVPSSPPSFHAYLRCCAGRTRRHFFRFLHVVAAAAAFFRRHAYTVPDA